MQYYSRNQTDPLFDLQEALTEEYDRVRFQDFAPFLMVNNRYVRLLGLHAWRKLLEGIANDNKQNTSLEAKPITLTPGYTRDIM